MRSHTEGGDSMHGPGPGDGGGGGDQERTGVDQERQSRRRVLRTMLAGLGMGLVGSRALQPQAAEAANGDPLLLATANKSGRTTTVTVDNLLLNPAPNAIEGVATSTTDNPSAGIRGTNLGGGSGKQGGFGVWGVSDHGDGVRGENLTGAAGVHGRSSRGHGVTGDTQGQLTAGVRGINTYGSSDGGFGVWGESQSGHAVYGRSYGKNGVLGIGITNGVEGDCDTATGSGVLGRGQHGAKGVVGTATDSHGVYGQDIGVGVGVTGTSFKGVGVRAGSKDGVALQVLGRAMFQQSGVNIVGHGTSQCVVPIPGLGTTNRTGVIVTPQTDVGANTVSSASLDPVAQTLTIRMAAPVSKDTRVAWLIIN